MPSQHVQEQYKYRVIQKTKREADRRLKLNEFCKTLMDAAKRAIAHNDDH